MLKKTLLGCFATAIIATNAIDAFSGTAYLPDSPHALNVTTPCVNSGWELGAQALYLQALYGTPSQTRFDDLMPRVENAHKGWDWGYRLTGAYHLPNAKTFDLSWLHYSNTSKQSALFGITPLRGAGLLPVSYFSNLYFDQVNITVNQTIEAPTNALLSFYAGLQFAQLHLNIQNFYPILPLPYSTISPAGLSHNLNTDTNGVGPTLGVNYQYALPYNLALEAAGSGSLLYGTSRYGGEYIFRSNGLVITSGYASQRIIIPSLEGKLGLNYLYALENSSINIGGGYQIINYFNLPGLGWPHEHTQQNSVNFSLQGAYMGAKWLGYI